MYSSFSDNFITICTLHTICTLPAATCIFWKRVWTTFPFGGLFTYSMELHNAYCRNNQFQLLAKWKQKIEHWFFVNQEFLSLQLLLWLFQCFITLWASSLMKNMKIFNCTRMEFLQNQALQLIFLQNCLILHRGQMILVTNVCE